jgi:hypothetical protein
MKIVGGLPTHAGRRCVAHERTHFLDDVGLDQGLRHTVACQWLERGGSLAALQQIPVTRRFVSTQRYARLRDDLVVQDMG